VNRIDQVAARGFGRAADDYELGRPGYPPQAIDWLTEVLGIAEDCMLVDLGAGTGKLTRALVPSGARVVALEPVPAMRRKLSEMVPEVRVVAGRAEAIPLPDESADAVVAGQAFHWFEAPAARRQIHRVLRPQGGLGLIWNVRDRSVDWLASFYGIVDPFDSRDPAHSYRSGHWRQAFDGDQLFTPLEERSFRHEQSVDAETFLAQVASMSFVAAAPEPQRRELLGRVAGLLRSHPSTAGRPEILVPYETRVYWCRKLTE
jgi:SAM-dependent methyltransferase